MKSNLSYILFIFYLFYFHTSSAQSIDKKKIEHTIPKDSIVTDTIKRKKEFIKNIITHNAEYTTENIKNRTAKLHDKAHVIYGDIDLKAGNIFIDYKNNRVYASGIKDSTGKKLTQRPVFKQGSQESQQDSIVFNFKTKKALVYGVNTMQGEMLVYGEKTKRVNDSTIYIRNIRFTTSKKENPDYYIATNKAKLVPGKKIIVGASNMVIADVPTPLYLPFAYFPLQKGRTSGFLIPTWGENTQQGFFLQNGGYYFAVNDYFDFEVTGDIYSNGSWAVNTGSNYYVKYKYSGSLSANYQNNINSLRGFNDYSKNKNFNIKWSHRQDAKSNPNSQLSASVNVGTSKFYKESFNEADANQVLRNTMNSSINYYQNFVGTPFNMSTTLSHGQNSNTEEITMTFPSVQLNMSPQYPFTGKGGVKKNAIHRIGINYNTGGQYQINTNDAEFLKPKMFKEAKTGIQHNASASTNLKVFKYFTLNPSLSYKDTWYFNKIEKKYDSSHLNPDGSYGSAVNDTINGFNRFNHYSAGVSLSTNIFGTFKFKNKKLKTIRHTIRPSFSWSYSPDLSKKHLKKVQNSADPNNILEYTQFEGGVYGTPSRGKSNLLGITLNNVLEAKVAPKEDENEEKDKKITILRNLDFRTSYNFALDSLNWSDLSVSTGTSIFKNKVSITLTGSFDPYQVTDKGTRVNKFNDNIFRLENARLSTNFSLSSKDFDKKNKGDDKNKKPNNTDSGLTAKVGQTSNEFAHQVNSKTDNSQNKKTTNLYRANIPWNISVGYSATYQDNGYSESGIRYHTVSLNGNIELSPKWKVGFNSPYDIKDGAFSYTQLSFSRDLDSFRFNFNWTPFGYRKSYYFFIGIKSSLLSDLKWDKNRPPDRRLY